MPPVRYWPRADMCCVHKMSQSRPRKQRLQKGFTHYFYFLSRRKIVLSLGAMEALSDSVGYFSSNTKRRFVVEMNKSLEAYMHGEFLLLR